MTGKSSGQDLLDVIFKHLNLLETAYFGLRYQDTTNQTHWLDPSRKVGDQLRGISPITLYLGVKFYAADPCRLVEEITRYQFFLQVKSDVLQGRLPVSQDLAIELASYALQSELGDYDSSRHSPGYVSEFRFVSSQTEEMEDDIEQTHRKLQGMLPSEAEMAYLEKVKWLDMYGVDLHPVVGEDNIEYYLGLTPSGIIVLRNRGKVGNYFWPRIAKIYFKGRFFMLRVRDKHNDESTYGFETPSRQACKHLWKCCVEHHAFFRLVQVSPSFGGTGVFSLGSRFRFSGSTEKQALSQVQSVRRPPPNFSRRPSTRYSRRNGQPSMPRDQPDGQADDHPHSYEDGSAKPILNGSLHRNVVGKRSNGILPHRSTSSLPRNVSLRNRAIGSTGRPDLLDQAGPEESLQDLSLQSLQWLESRGLYGTNRTRGNRRGSTSEMGTNSLVNTHLSHRAPSRKSMGNASDNESEASGVSLTSGLHPHQRRRHESGSESEKSSRRTHRSRRKRQGSYKLVESDEQWQAIQQQRSSNHRGRSSSRASGIGIQEAGVRKSGYMNSGAETESEMTTVSSSMRRTRRRQRSRSRSPASEARHRLPAEVLQHVEFGLVEPNCDSVKGEIPFTNVETARPVKLRGYGSPTTPSGSQTPVSTGRRSRHNSGGTTQSRTRIHVPAGSMSETSFPNSMSSQMLRPNINKSYLDSLENPSQSSYPPLGLPLSTAMIGKPTTGAISNPSQASTFLSFSQGPPSGTSGVISAAHFNNLSSSSSSAMMIKSSAAVTTTASLASSHQVGLPGISVPSSYPSVPSSISGLPSQTNGWYDSMSTGSNSFVMAQSLINQHHNNHTSYSPHPTQGLGSYDYQNDIKSSTPLAGAVNASLSEPKSFGNAPMTPGKSRDWNSPFSNPVPTQTQSNTPSSSSGLWNNVASKPRRYEPSGDEMSTEL